MPSIVTLSELKTYLGDAPASADDTLLTALLNSVEAMYERATLRPPGFYVAPDFDCTEVLDGSGSSRIYVAYPIDVVTSITLGYDADAPDETLAVANKAVVSYGAGSRVIARTDGGWFGTVGQSRYVTVVYDHLGNIPIDAKIPIMEVAASLYRNRGSEGMKSETVGSFYSYTRDDVMATASSNPNWQLSVMANSPVVFA